MSERSIIRFLLKVGPWLAPLITVFVVQRSMGRHFELPFWVAWPGSVVIEILGVGAIYLTLETDNWNRRNPNAQQARHSLSWVLAGMYIITTLMLVIALDVVPGLERWALAVIPLMSVVAYLEVSVFAHLEDLEGEKRRIKDERKQAKFIAEGNASIAAVATPVTPVASRGNYGMYLQEQTSRNGDGLMTVKEIMDRFSVPLRTAYNWREKYARGQGN